MAWTAALILGVTLLFPPPTWAACAYVDVADIWTITQRNVPFLQIDIQQSGPNIQGRATYETSHGDYVHGTFDGLVGPDRVNFTVRWENGTVGLYSGTLKFVSRDDESSAVAEYFQGSTFEQGHPDNNATWTSPQRQHFKCLADDGQTTHLDFGIPPSPAPPKALGRTNAPPKLPPVSRRTGPLAELPLSTPTSPRTSICALAAAARARHASDAAGLEAQCRALSGRP